MTRARIQMIVLGGLAFLLLAGVLVWHSAGGTSPSADAAGQTAAAQPVSTQTDTTPLFPDAKGHGDVGAQPADKSGDGTKADKSAAVPKADKKPDPYLVYQQSLVKQQLDEKLAQQANEEKARETAYDAPLPKGNYHPGMGGGGDGSATPALAQSFAPAGSSTRTTQGASSFIGGQPGAGAPSAQASDTDVGYLKHGAIAPRSPYEIQKGSVIPAVLVTGINSDLPGHVTGQVSEDVYDSRTGGTVLIPKGSKLFGTYDNKLTYGQQRVVVTWSHLIFPNGATLLLENQMGTDTTGQSGFHDIRKGNFLRILMGNLLFSVVGAGQQALEARIQQQISGSAETSSALGDLINGAQGLGAGNAAAGAAGVFNAQNASARPTLIIRPGYRFDVLVAKDIVLKPWGAS